MAGSGQVHMRPEDQRLLSVEDLVVEFPADGRRRVHAVSGISFDLLPGETLGILGESGCGKSTAGRAVLQLPAPTSGRVRLGSADLTDLRGRKLRRTRRRLQMIMQDPLASLNPRRRIQDIVAEGPSLWRESVGEEEIAAALDAVGLPATAVWYRRPHELSGGQAQRVSIARALMVRPEVLICDEPVSSLDVSVQAQILNLLERTRDDQGLSMIFIAHDLSVVKNIADRVMVLYLGKVCEVVDSRDLATAAAHPYTQLLLESLPERLPSASDAVPLANGAGELPSPIDPPSGCRFRTRCPLVTAVCADEEPPLREVGPGQFVACHHV